MRVIPLRDAKAGLAAVVDQAARGESTVVTRRGKPVAVIVGHDEWQRLTGARPGFAELLLGFPEGGDLDTSRNPDVRGHDGWAAGVQARRGGISEITLLMDAFGGGMVARAAVSDPTPSRPCC